MKKILYGFLSFLLLNTFVMSAASASEQNANNQAALSKNNNDFVDVVFVLDTTGSMASLIDGAKKKIWSIANTIVDINSDVNIRMALVVYRDRGDNYTVKMAHQLDSDIQGLYSVLMGLVADGGGDTPESVNEALNSGINEIQWGQKTKGSKRIVFLVGDAPPHMDYLDEKQFPAIVEEAIKKGIIVNTVQAGNSTKTRKFWKKIAKLGKGMYLPIPQDGGVITEIQTPYDDEILQVQDKLDKTVIAYGSRSTQREIEEKLSVKKGASISTQAENASYYAKRSKKEVVTGKGDLVSDIANEKVNIRDLKNKDLPEKLKNQSIEEIASAVQKNLKIRRSLETEMAELVKKRDDYISQHKPSYDSNDSFDKAVKRTLKKQMKD